MSMSWLPLTDYSTKYKVSVSTLRRRIKAEDIKFQFSDGKYFISDEPLGTHQRVHRPSLKSEQAQVGLPQERSLKELAGNNELVLSAANKLLNELKRAYTQILQEKEEQILQLKEEITDLKTLVRVLESENQRYRG